MCFKKLTIQGIRGFREKVSFEFAVPNGKKGSGLTVLVGPNNSGKSTVIESIFLLNRERTIVTEGARNQKSPFVDINLECIEGSVSLKSVDEGGALVKKEFFSFKDGKGIPFNLNTFIVSSNKKFDTYFFNAPTSRDNYSISGGGEYRQDMMNQNNSNFGGRLYQASISEENKKVFDRDLKKIIGNELKWTIDANSSDQVFLKINSCETIHSSKGMGDGYFCIFRIVDSLYDAGEGDVIIIDEPEIALHPNIQRKLLEYILEHSKDKQIILATHSPIFIDWESIVNEKSKLIRLVNDGKQVTAYQMSNNTIQKVNKNLANDLEKPHLLGLDASEIYFLEDNILITEGQEDVIVYRKILKNYFNEFNFSFYGWGAGGANKIETVLSMLFDLGYKKVTAIFDGDKNIDANYCKEKFPNYLIQVIPTEDVRDKKVPTKKEGLIRSFKLCEVKCEYIELFEKIVESIKSYFNYVDTQLDKLPEEEKEIKSKRKIDGIIDSYTNLESEKVKLLLSKKFPSIPFEQKLESMTDLEGVENGKIRINVTEKWLCSDGETREISFMLLIGEDGTVTESCFKCLLKGIGE